MPRLILALTPVLLLAGQVRAQEPSSLLRAEGTTLESFSVRYDSGSLKRSTPAELADSYARYVTQQQAASRMFGTLFRNAHVDLLKRYLAPPLVQRQEAAYATGPQAPAMKCSVAKAEDAGALLRRSWTDPRTGKAASRMVRLDMEKRQGVWWVKTILVEVETGKFVDRGLGIPPPEPPADVPAKVRPNLVTAHGLVSTLRDDMLRLRALGVRGRNAVYRSSFLILGDFFGRDRVEAVRRRQPKPPAAGPAHRFDVVPPRDPDAGLVRIEVVVKEEIPGAEGKWSAIGQSVFDVRRIEGRWRVTGEWNRPDPKQPLVALNRGFALFFLG